MRIVDHLLDPMWNNVLDYMILDIVTTALKLHFSLA